MKNPSDWGLWSSGPQKIKINFGCALEQKFPKTNKIQAKNIDFFDRFDSQI